MFLYNHKKAMKNMENKNVTKSLQKSIIFLSCYAIIILTTSIIRLGGVINIHRNDNKFGMAEISAAIIGPIAILIFCTDKWICCKKKSQNNIVPILQT